jgi:predicted Rossmann fold nucleotide-binding protein DprA/Smf involved in DNA uptake
MSAGAHALVRDADATLVTSADEVIALVMPPGQRWPRDRRNGLTFDQVTLLDALKSSLTEFSGFVQSLRRSEKDMTADAFLLERWGLIKRVSNGWVIDRRTKATKMPGGKLSNANY